MFVFLFCFLFEPVIRSAALINYGQ